MNTDGHRFFAAKERRERKSIYRATPRTRRAEACEGGLPGILSPRHETEADGTPISESARCGFGKKTKTTKILI
jgi:hypothetical protein